MSWASIWDVLGSERESLLGKEASVEGNFEDYMKKAEKALVEKKERRNVRFNLARLDPFASSIPNDSISSTRAESSAKYHFYNKAEDCFEAPETWPNGENLLIGVLSPSIGKAGTDAFRIYGKQHVRDGFWWAYAMAMTAVVVEDTQAARDRVKGFEALCLRAVADFKLFERAADIDAAAFQRLLSVEEEHANNGFFGFRKVLMAQWSENAVIAAKPKGSKIDPDDILNHLHEKLHWPDEKSKPTKHILRDLLAIGKDFVKNGRAMNGRCRIKRQSCRQSFQRQRCLESGRLSSSGHVAKMKKATLHKRRPRCRTHGDRTKTRVVFFRCLHGHVANFGQVAINLRGQVAVIGSERTRRHSDRCQG